ncbi:hypothetical protein JW887_01830 [Candidatus Dojkabacteria bacterium]|nr:hypothetical protein [Candidatus Dojkabacteria bacterium]
MKSFKDLLKDQQHEMIDRHKYVTKEFQDFGYRLALKLNDLKHKSLYIKLAKEKPRAILDQALSFAIDYPNAGNKARIFMWKIKDLSKSDKEKEKENSKLSGSKEKQQAMDIKASIFHKKIDPNSQEDK